MDVQAADITATNGVHYNTGVTTLTFPEGEVFATLTIPVVDDFEVNTDRIAELELSNIVPPGSAALGNQPSAYLTIVNEDSAISFETGSFTVAENAVDSQAAIRVIRFGSLVGTASVDFTTTTNGSATVSVSFRGFTAQAVITTLPAFIPPTPPVAVDDGGCD